MNSTEAKELLAPAIATSGGVWSDLGAGSGVFTRALAELLGPGSHIYAIDRDAAAVAALAHVARAADAKITPIMSDFSLSFDLPSATLLDGLLFANSLHYVRNAAEVLTRLVASLKPGGRVVFVEYDRLSANRWVPYPICIADLPTLANSAGLSVPRVVARHPSAYQGELYVAVADKPAGDEKT